jgi:hypothetical protein
MKAVRSDWRITFFRSGSVHPDVRKTKTGRTPDASKATKRGMKGSKISKETICFIMWSSQLIPERIPKRDERGKL